MASRLLDLYRRISPWPAGHWLFSRLVCLKAPYFASIAPTITCLQPARCEARMAHRRRVTNHLGTVHAIALCNLAELVAGVMVDASLPPGMRWIPKGMQVRYLKKAAGTLQVVATPQAQLRQADAGYDLPVQVVVRDPTGEAVFTATIDIWMSPRPAKP